MGKFDDAVTFKEPAYALWSTVDGAVLTTFHGSLAIFSTRAMAEIYRDQLGGVEVIAVTVKPVDD